MISFMGKNGNVVYKNSKPIKWGFRPYDLADLYTGYTYCFKLLEDLYNNEFGKMYNLIIFEFMNKLKINNINKIKHVLSADGLYTCEKFIENEDFYFIVSISKNKIKTNREIILSPIDKKHYDYEYLYKENSNSKSVLIKYNDAKTMYVICNFLNGPKEVERIKRDKKDNNLKKNCILKLFINIVN